ncbi:MULTISPECIES: hypothetical protein [Corynebacterium]|nr:MULTISPECIES: hypothetical protein [Corynebacterium]OFT64092.1 hypothetical protein HMPREF3148_04250 [Corynebacterium sp. HMSC05D08]
MANAEYSMRYIAPGGQVYNLLRGGRSGAFIDMGTLTGFVGEFEDAPVKTVGVAGVMVDFRDRVVNQMTGSFTLVVFSREEWVQARRDFSTRQYGTLILEGESRYVLRVRSSVSLPAPGSVPRSGTRIELSLVSDDGVWVSEVSEPDSVVTVTNWGDVPVWPRIVWDGAGGSVILPSGAELHLPAVDKQHTLHLERRESGRVYTRDGVAKEVTRKVDAVGECVPVGESRTFTIPEGARLDWEIGVFDPWI